MTLASVVIVDAIRSPSSDAQVGVVVDVTVQRGHDVRRLRTAGLFEFERVERMGVGLADDADARPASVAQDRHPGARRLQGPPKQRIGAQRTAQGGGVVAEFSDLGSGLVHEREALVGLHDRSGLEQRVGAAVGDECGQRIGLDVVAPYEHVEPSGVAASYFEPVDRRERLLHGEVPAERRRGCVSSSERLDLACRAETIVTDGPEGVLEIDQFGVGALERVGIEPIGVAVEAVLDVRGRGIEPVEPGSDRRHQVDVAGQREHAGQPAQELVDAAHLRGRADDIGRHGGDRGHRTIESGDQVSDVGRRPRRWPTDDADDAAHGPSGYCRLRPGSGQPTSHR